MTNNRWWVLAVRSALAAIIAIAAFFCTDHSVAMIVWGAYAFADGMTAVVAGGLAERWPLAFAGLVGVTSGLAAIAFAMVRPESAAFAVLLLIADWSIVRGVFDIIQGRDLPRREGGVSGQIESGIVSIVFGLVIGFAAGYSATFLIGSYAAIVSGLLFSQAMRLRHGGQHDRAMRFETAATADTDSLQTRRTAA